MLAVTISLRGKSLSGGPGINMPPSPVLGPPRAEELDMHPNASTVLGILLAAALLYVIYCPLAVAKA